MTRKSLDTLHIEAGAHANAEAGLCAMEAVAWLAKEPHSDAPGCACPILSSYVRILNDKMPDEQRQLLKTFIPQLVGSRNPALELERSYILAWSAITVFVPLVLRAAGLVNHAEILTSLPRYDWKGAVLAADATSYACAAESAAANAADAAYYAANAAANAARAAANAADAAYHAARATANAASSISDWKPALAALQQALDAK